MNYISSILSQTVTAWNEHEAPRLGAALAFYTMLSLAPLVVLAIAILASVVGDSRAQNQLLGQVQGMIGAQGSEAVKEMIEHGQRSSSGAVASVFGGFTLLLGASGVFGELRAALNKMWDVELQSAGGLWGMIKQRFFSFGMVLAVGFLLLVSLLISAALAAVGRFSDGLLPVSGFVLNSVDFAVSFGAIVVLFALIFMYVPATKVARRNVWIGATVTAWLFTIGKFFISLYLGKVAIGSAYGAAGSLIVVIVGVYYSAMIFLFGAEFTHVLDSSGHRQNK
jgi:membrane protein